MSRLDITAIEYRGKTYPVTSVPDLFTHDEDSWLLIGSHSLNLALFDDEHGYADEQARYIDEQIYGFVDDDSFQCDYETFVKRVAASLD